MAIPSLFRAFLLLVTVSTAVQAGTDEGTRDATRRATHTLSQRTANVAAYLGHALALTPNQVERIKPLVAAYLRGQQQPAASRTQTEQQYRDAMHLVLEPGQYSTFCWLQERLP